MRSVLAAIGNVALTAAQGFVLLGAVFCLVALPVIVVTTILKAVTSPKPALIVLGVTSICWLVGTLNND